MTQTNDIKNETCNFAEVPVVEKPLQSASSKRPDIFTILLSSFAIIIIVGACIFFILSARLNASLGMTLSEYKSAYFLSEGYSQLYQYGFSFPDCTISQTDANGDTSIYFTFFTGKIDNSIGYNASVSGRIVQSNDYLKSIRVSLSDVDATEIDIYKMDAIYIFAPFIQSIFPEMTHEECSELFVNLFKTDGYITEGEFGLSAAVDLESESIILDIIPRQDV